MSVLIPLTTEIFIFAVSAVYANVVFHNGGMKMVPPATSNRPITL